MSKYEPTPVAIREMCKQLHSEVFNAHRKPSPAPILVVLTYEQYIVLQTITKALSR